MSDEKLGHGGMTDCEYDFLLAKAEGRIPATTGWQEYRRWWEEQQKQRESQRPMRIGIAVTCAVCGDMKKPVGRSGPLGASYCEPRYPGESGGCEGYWQEPKPGSLWPGETEEEFGYPVGPDGTKGGEMAETGVVGVRLMWSRMEADGETFCCRRFGTVEQATAFATAQGISGLVVDERGTAHAVNPAAPANRLCTPEEPCPSCVELVAQWGREDAAEPR